MATSLFRRRRFEECVKTCTEILERNPYDQVRASRHAKHKDTIRLSPMPLPYSHDTQAAWCLKARALTEQTYVDEVELEEEGIAELFMDDTAIADVASKEVVIHSRSLALHFHCY